MHKGNLFEESLTLSIADVLGKEDDELTGKILERISFYCGGLVLYIPTHNGHTAKQKKQAIIQEFNGKNHSELALKHKVSIQYIYMVLRNAKKQKHSYSPKECAIPSKYLCMAHKMEVKR